MSGLFLLLIGESIRIYIFPLVSTNDFRHKILRKISLFEKIALSLRR